ncbi:MAG: homoserine dehydrogenase [Candidatus Fischerbacteria bacterium RBG_13_37_8]|uniref:Homoserine dehydrogenase n=1 Tax=Candidatus Fischerbacteria bacterium RBG_13_37_8 TaxID=1817863 RepID=A0A1F5VXC0_9BACT|nr:MAG: homoserine dehydrogenase [Candidatus Fischerbacteria bacterium RBG_13_37_8]
MKLLLIGFGTVGQGLAELLLEKKEALAKQYNFKYTVVGINDMLKGSIYDAKGIDLAKALKTVKSDKKLTGGPEKALEMIKKAKADVMLEATYTDIKTGEPATSHIKEALKKGMHVITTNKGPLALNYKTLSNIARKNKAKFLYEGTVMSGSPLINLIRETLAGSEIKEIKGILNGTTNYILTRMEEGLSYEEALKKAQELGYAEAVPDADVLGWDALAKVTILANSVFGAELKPFDNPCEGITKITADDIKKAKANGKRFKLIGHIWKEGKKVKASVSPQQVELTHPLAGVMGATNALTIATDTVKEVTIVGPGAGRRETGYSMLNDLLHLNACKK